jgi:5S rRNA maturation endonuclease (ribonuclease M5)
MDRPQIEQWLIALGSKAEDSPTSDWIHGACPFAPWNHESGVDSNPSFGVQLGPGESKTYCLACGASGKQYEIMLKLQHLGLEFDFHTAAELVYAAEDGQPLADLPEPYEKQFDEKASPHLYPEWLADAFEPAYFEQEHPMLPGGGFPEEVVHPYLASRGMPFEIAKKLNMRYDPYRLRVLFPVLDWRGRLRGLHGRAVCLPCGGEEWEQNIPYKMYPYENQTNAHIWLGEQWASADEPLIVAESVFDLARVLEVYQNVISPLTATLSAVKIARLRKASRVITLFDSDKAGDRARLKLRQGLTTTSIKHIELPPGTDASDHTAEEIWELIAYLL